MFLGRNRRRHGGRRFPRVRGDVPSPLAHNNSSGKFSPRARGCSAAQRASASSNVVFPACAGMFLGALQCSRHKRGFPRVRGDVPALALPAQAAALFSPRARGCSSSAPGTPASTGVFPACAGMFPRQVSPQRFHRRFPRVRGDVPIPTGNRRGRSRFSPRARGCSPTCSPSKARQVVFPACAGMFPQGCIKHDNTTSFPRVRGDVPTSV